MKHLLLSLLFVTISVPSSAQDIYPLRPDYFYGYQLPWNNLDAHDSLTVWMPDQEIVLFGTPRVLRRGDADSIAVWGSLPDGCVLKVGTAYDENNFRVIEHGGTLTGPLDYGCYWIPFELDTNAQSLHSKATYIMLKQHSGIGAQIDAVDLAMPKRASVVLDLKSPVLLIDKSHARWYNELGVQDSVHGVIRH